MNDRPTLTTLLQALGRGDRTAHDEAFALVYRELKRIAGGHVRRAGGRLSVNPTMLVHEAWLKFAGGDRRTLNDSQHFYKVLAGAMRQILLDIAKSKGAVKRGRGAVRTELTERVEQDEMPLEELLAIDGALDQLAACDAELAELVEWHFFAGLSFEEIATLRAVNERTVRRHWQTARAFLLRAMDGGAPVA
jgi:RNA polymerase sigma factor (TIGR02999 family)